MVCVVCVAPKTPVFKAFFAHLLHILNICFLCGATVSCVWLLAQALLYLYELAFSDACDTHDTHDPPAATHRKHMFSMCGFRILRGLCGPCN